MCCLEAMRLMRLMSRCMSVQAGAINKNKESIIRKATGPDNFGKNGSEFSEGSIEQDH